MKECKGCGQLAVDPTEPARYDVLNPDLDPYPGEQGPYCAACWPATVTGGMITKA